MKNSDPLKALGIRVMSQDFQKQLKGYGLTTANILYRRPDHPRLLQTYVWQNYDPAQISRICSFFWNSGGNRSKVSCIQVTVVDSRLIKPAEIKPVDGIFRLH